MIGFYIIVIIIIIIIISNFFFVGIIQHFKILQDSFSSKKKLIKANYKPSKMKVLKDTFQQSFKLHIYWWELRIKKKAQTHTYLHVHINAHTHKRISTCKYKHAHIDYRHNYIIIYK